MTMKSAARRRAAILPAPSPCLSARINNTLVRAESRKSCDTTGAPTRKSQRQRPESRTVVGGSNRSTTQRRSAEAIARREAAGRSCGAKLEPNATGGRDILIGSGPVGYRNSAASHQGFSNVHRDSSMNHRDNSMIILSAYELIELSRLIIEIPRSTIE